jgi:D-psicose/D-tagatose/L-ribulose 3-epimerase
MRFGVNTQIWCAPFRQADLDLIDKVADMGFGYIELGFASEEPPFSVAEVKQRTSARQISCGVCSFLPGDRDIANPDPEVRKRGVAYMQALLASTAAIGGEVLSGPLYAELFRARFVPPEQRKREWDWSVASLREVAKSAETQGVTLALEPLNRFETDFLNQSAQAVRLAEDVGSNSVGILLDTFHMQIEEKNQGEAIRQAGKHLKHFHSCENDRGSPGTGQVDWSDVRVALQDIGYDGYVVIEGFNPDNVDLANGARIWRPMAPTPDRLASDGLAFLKSFFPN